MCFFLTSIISLSASRIEHTKAKVLITSSYALESYKKIELAHDFVEKALEKSQHKPKVLCLNRNKSDSIPKSFADFDSQMKKMEKEPICKPEVRENERARNTYDQCLLKILDSRHPVYYLHTSGTTGAPKALCRENGGQAVAIYNAMWDIFGVRGFGDTMFAASDVGWVVG